MIYYFVGVNGVLGYSNIVLDGFVHCDNVLDNVQFYGL
jgi:hypothetical protein